MLGEAEFNCSRYKHAQLDHLSYGLDIGFFPGDFKGFPISSCECKGHPFILERMDQSVNQLIIPLPDIHGFL